MRNTNSVRLFLRFFIVSVLANAVLGIWALLSEDFGETQGDVLVSSFFVSAAMLSVLVNVPAIRRRALWPAPLIGAGAGASGFAYFIVLAWVEPSDGPWGKLLLSFMVVAAAFTLASSLALITPPDRLRWMQPVGNTLIAALGITMLVGLWAEPDVDWYGRLLGIEGVLVAAITLLIPVLSRFSSSRRQESSVEDSPPGPAAVRFCPSCGRPVAPGPLGTGRSSACEACGLTFGVRASPQIGPASVTSNNGAAERVAP